ncbi:MAG: M24 family metallopeptidase [Desulfopila sp.]
MTLTFSSTPSQELQARREQLQKTMSEKGVDGALIIQKTDLFYFSGTGQQGWLYIPCTGEPVLMVFKEYERARAESHLTNVISLVSPKSIPEVLQERGLALPAVLGMELDVLPTNLFFQYQKIFPAARIIDISLEIRLIRAIKSAYEIERVKASCQLADKVTARVADLVMEGKSEVQLAGEVEAYARSLGHQGIVRMRLWGNELFYGHLMAGPAAAVPSYLASPTGGEGVSTLVAQGAGYRKIHRNEPILVDYVFALNGYIADQTRIFSLGQLPDDLMCAHQAMLDLQDTVKKLALPGVASGDLYEQMLELVAAKGYSEHFMGVGERRIRFTGHGVGLELDEFPFIAKGQKLRLAAGMVIALEPKMVFPGRGVVGIENTHLVTDQGLETLTVTDEGICTV